MWQWAWQQHITPTDTYVENSCFTIWWGKCVKLDANTYRIMYVHTHTHNHTHTHTEVCDYSCAEYCQINFHIVPPATRSPAPLLLWKAAGSELTPQIDWELITPSHPPPSFFPLSAAFVAAAIIPGVLMVSQTLLVREEEEGQSEKSRTKGDMEE